MRRYGGRRDANERAIIDALTRVGAAVQQLEPPAPDLLVSYRDILYLIEVKDADAGLAARSPHRRNSLEGPMAALTPSQVTWWMHWRGKAPVIVMTVDEALAAIGALTPADSGSLGGADGRQMR